MRGGEIKQCQSFRCWDKLNAFEFRDVGKKARILGDRSPLKDINCRMGKVADMSSAREDGRESTWNEQVRSEQGQKSVIKLTIVEQ